jgi:Na+/proline symporter
MAVQLLTKAEGYGIIIGLSVLFCVIIVAAVQIQKRYLSEDSDESEMFMVANRSVGTGLTASAVFSSWFVNQSHESSMH